MQRWHTLLLSFLLRLNDFRCERGDLEELLLAQFAGDGSEDACADRFIGLIDDHGRVLIEVPPGSLEVSR